MATEVEATKPFKVPQIPESVLKRRKQRAESRAKDLATLVKRRQLLRQTRRVIFHKAEKYVKMYREKERDEIRLKRLARNNFNFYVPEKPKIVAIIRIRGVNGISPKSRKILQLFRLRQINNAMFFKNTKSVMNMLRFAQPFVTWGYPNLKSVKDMVYKRGFARIDKRRVPITNNKMIEDHLGRHGIICMEDLIHEIYTGGPNFGKATRFLWHFKLNNPKGGWRKKTINFVEGGDFGNREEEINSLLRKMI